MIEICALRRPNDHRMAALGKHDLQRTLLGADNDPAHQLPFRAEQSFQPLDISSRFGRLDVGHTILDGCGGHGRHHFEQHAVIQRLGDDVVGTETDRLPAIRANDGIWDVFAG